MSFPPRTAGNDPSDDCFDHDIVEHMIPVLAAARELMVLYSLPLLACNAASNYHEAVKWSRCSLLRSILCCHLKGRPQLWSIGVGAYKARRTVQSLLKTVPSFQPRAWRPDGYLGLNIRWETAVEAHGSGLAVLD